MSEDTASLLSLLEGLIETRNEFFSASNIRMYPFPTRSNLAIQYLISDRLYLDILNRICTANMQTHAAASTLITLSMPHIDSSFLDPVTIRPTQAQIESSLENIIVSPSYPCAVCQESLSSDTCGIRQCGHCFHRSCIVSWFSMSVRCPVCRFDIRQEGPSAQTSSVSE